MSKKARELEEQKRKARDARKRQLTLVAGLALIAIIAIVVYVLFFSGSSGNNGKIWHLDSAALLTFDKRPAVNANVSLVESNDNWTLEKVSYQSFGTTVYALLRVPKGVDNPPVVIVLPAASINKEADSDMAKALCSWGYATLTLDERGNNGETAGPSASNTNLGLQAYTDSGNPVQYEQFYDVLLGYDYVAGRSDLDGSNVSIIGESMGTWYAIVAAVLEPKIKLVCEISAVPYAWEGSSTAEQVFYKSIEPASYLSSLPPRKIAFFHFTDDPIVPISYGKVLYSEASDPKVWYQYNGTIHGLYSDVYAADLHNELRSVFSR